MGCHSWGGGERDDDEEEERKRKRRRGEERREQKKEEAHTHAKRQGKAEVNPSSHNSHSFSLSPSLSSLALSLITYFLFSRVCGVCVCGQSQQATVFSLSRLSSTLPTLLTVL